MEFAIHNSLPIYAGGLGVLGGDVCKEVSDIGLPLVATGLSFAEATSRVQATTVFTTHTPVLAGHGTFPAQLLDKYLSGYRKSLGIGRETFSQLGLQDGDAIQSFNMTAFALRMANQRCGVSQLHGKVTEGCGMVFGSRFQKTPMCLASTPQCLSKRQENYFLMTGAK